MLGLQQEIQLSLAIHLCYKIILKYKQQQLKLASPNKTKTITPLNTPHTYTPAAAAAAATAAAAARTAKAAAEVTAAEAEAATAAAAKEAAAKHTKRSGDVYC